MRSRVNGNERQRPPWRHPQSTRESSDEEDFEAEALQPRHTLDMGTTMTATTAQPLRPPPLFHSRPGEAQASLAPAVNDHRRDRFRDGYQEDLKPYRQHHTACATEAAKANGHRDYGHRPAREVSNGSAAWPSLASSSSTAASSPRLTAHTPQQPLQSPSSQRTQDAPIHVPVSHWRQDVVTTSAHMPSTAGRVAAAREETHRLGMDDVTLHGAATVEHYHVLELEEQLQYWRQYALQMEGRMLRRERSIKEKYAADFAAAQATSEAIIRRLLDKQQRQRQLPERHRRDSSRSASAFSSSRSSSAASTVSGAEREAHLHGGLTTIAESHRGPAGRKHLPVQHEHPGMSLTRATAAHEPTRKAQERELRELRQRVDELTQANQALIRAGEKVRRKQRSAVSTSASEVASAAARSATSTPVSKDEEDRSVESTVSISDDVSPEIVSCSLQSHVKEVGDALLSCLEHGAELRRCTAAGPGLDPRGFSSSSLHDLVPADEAEQHQRVMQRLATAVRLPPRRQTNDSGARRNERAPMELYTRQLVTLRDTAVYLDSLILTCADDVVLAHSRWEELEQRKQQDRDDVQKTLHLPQQSPQQDEEREERRDALDAARASAELQAAHHTIQELKDRQAEYEAAFQEQEHALRQLAHKHAEDVAQVRDGFEEELMAAARRVSAAEHDCSLRTEEATQWRRRLSAVEEARDAYARECTVLQRRLEVLQQRETNQERQLSQTTSASTVSMWEAQRPTTVGERRPWTDDKEEVKRAAATKRTDGRLSDPVASQPLDAVSRDIHNDAASVSPSPRKSSTSTEDASRGRSETLKNERRGERTRDMHADATTPRRSLSYSPPVSAEKPALDGHSSPHDKLSAGMAAIGESVVAPRPSSAVVSTTPFYVVQPSLLSSGEIEKAKGRTTVHEAVRSRETPSPVTAIDAAATPLARMKAWEEKFKSILTPA